MMNRYIRAGLAASVIAGAVLVAPMTASALVVATTPSDVLVTTWVVPYQCVPVAGCATMVNVPPVEQTFVLRPFECVNSAGCATPYGW